MVETGKAVEQFQLRPRDRPPFDKVFYYQTASVATIAVTLYCHTFHLIVVFASLNMVKSKIEIVFTRKNFTPILFMPNFLT